VKKERLAGLVSWLHWRAIRKMDTVLQEDQVRAIGQNIVQVSDRIAQAARSVGRSPENVQLVVVSKLHSPELIKAAIRGGVRKFGENYIEEAAVKINMLPRPADLEWHMIGHIQSRKARLVADHFDVVQSVDSLKIAGRLSVACEGRHPLPVLLEINLSGEESKNGWPAQNEDHWEELLPDIAQIIALPNLQIKGLMTMPPLFGNPEMARPFFNQLVKFRDFLRNKIKGLEWNELSMGTSNDYWVAVQAGATLVRVGQAILGPRPTR